MVATQQGGRSIAGDAGDRAECWVHRHDDSLVCAQTLATKEALARDEAQALATKEAAARTEAQDLAKKEAKAREAALIQEQLAVDKAEQLAREDYINRVNRAYREVQDDNIALAEDLLHGCDINRRGWEWRFVERLCNSERRVVDLGGPSVNALAFGPDGTWAISGSGGSVVYARGDSSIDMWDVNTGQRQKTFPGAKGNVFDVAVSPDGKKIAAGFAAGLVIVWDMPSGQIAWTRSEPELSTMGVTFSPDARSLAVGYGNYSDNQIGRVKVWDVASGKEIRAFTCLRGGVNKVAFHPDGKRLAAAGSEVVEVWDLENSRKLEEIKGHKKWVYCVAYSPDGKWLATGGWDRTVKLRNAATGAEVVTIYAHEGFVLNLAFSPDSRSLVTASEDRSVRMWEIPSGRRVSTFHGHTDFVQTVAFRPGGREIGTGSFDGSLRFWDLLNSRPVVVEHGSAGTHFAFRRDSLRVVSESWFGSDTKSSQGLNPITGELDAKLSGIKFENLPGDYMQDSGRQPLSAKSPDGKLFAQASTLAAASTAARSKEYSVSAIIVREATNGQIVHTLTGHSAGVNSIAFSPDSRRLATASDDRTIKLWDMQTGKDVFTFLGHTAGIVTLAFSPDGNQIISSGYDLTARIWNATPLALNVTADHDKRYQKKIETLASLKATTDDLERAKILAGGGQWALAAEAFARAVAKEPENLQLHYQLVEAIVKAGDSSRVGYVCDEMLERFASYEARKSIVNLAAHSIEVLSAVNSRQPNDPQLQLAMARNRVDRGKSLLTEMQPAKALAELEKSRQVFMRLLSSGGGWTFLTPVAMKTETGAKLELQKDGSVFVRQPHSAKNDTYSLVFQSRLKGITGLRLEVLTDARLPQGGSGWAENGNFVLNELALRAAPADSPDKLKSITFRNASADFSQGSWDVQGAVDGNVKTGWGVHPEVKKNHSAVFELAERIGAGQELQLTVQLSHQYIVQDHNLGRFRLSFTDDDALLQATRTRLEVRDSEVVDLYIAIGRGFAQQGQTNDAAAAITRALEYARDDASRSGIIAAAAPLDGLLEKLAKQPVGDAQFQAALAQHFAEHGKMPLAVESFAWAVVKEPGDLRLRYQFIDALVKAGEASRIGPACSDLLERFGNTGDPLEALVVAGFCRLALLAMTDPGKRQATNEMLTAKDDTGRLYILAKDGQWDLIDQYRGKILEAEPEDANTLQRVHFLAHALEGKRPTDAEPLFRRASSSSARLPGRTRHLPSI